MMIKIDRENPREDGDFNFSVNGKTASGPHDGASWGSGNLSLAVSDPAVTSELVKSKWEELPSEVRRIFMYNHFAWLSAPHHMGFNTSTKSLEQAFDLSVSDKFTIWIGADKEYWGEGRRLAEYCDEFGRRAAKGRYCSCSLQFSDQTFRFTIEIQLRRHGRLRRQPGQTIASFIEPIETILCDLHNETVRALASAEAAKAGETDNIVDDSYLRLYVPDDKYDAEQKGSIIRLFESYMRGVEGKDVQVDTQRTSKGTLYVFRNSNNTVEDAQNDLPDALKRFNQFMALCKSDPERAVDFAKVLGIPEVDARPFVSKSARSYTRIQTDTRQEHEKLNAKIRSLYGERMLALQHDFESEAMELSVAWPARFDALPNSYLGDFMLSPQGSGAIIKTSQAADMLQNRLLDRVIAEVAESEDTLSDRDRELLQIIRDKAKNAVEATSLETDLRIASDDAVRLPMRKQAWNSIKKFFDDNKGTITESAFKVLLDYCTRPPGS